MTQPIEATTMTLVSLALDAAAMRQQVGAHNIAVANTGAPLGRVEFEDRLTAIRSQLQSGTTPNLEQLRAMRPQVIWDGGSAKGVAGLDQEAARLSQNALHYQALVRSLGHYLDLRSSAINDGKR
ncbi:flagellar basal body rod protein FlgB [Aquabacterium humicola]|uniref:flagellar basal body rod protein FlgB n=1 Tax=Aquabacterium humicola TaxID=3237377 RepID=UPI002543A264|nr:flagellar basal body protein [Rubrivivax pictus]